LYTELAMPAIATVVRMIRIVMIPVYYSPAVPPTQKVAMRLESAFFRRAFLIAPTTNVAEMAAAGYAVRAQLAIFA
jgi:hypothetical protein